MASPPISHDPRDRLIFALDVDSSAEALAWADRLQGLLPWLKVGPKLFTAAGPELVQTLVARGFKIFLDLKFHDIPEVVAGALREAVRLRVSLVTLHTSGGPRMMRAAADAARDEALRLELPAPLLLGVTVLTSLDSADLARIGFRDPADDTVDRLAALARLAGLDGVVCSPREIARVKALSEQSLVVLTPGIRPASLSESGELAAPGRDDQRRVATPGQAIRDGADFLVVGRPIRLAADPAVAVSRVLEEMRAALPAPGGDHG